MLRLCSWWTKSSLLWSNYHGSKQFSQNCSWRKLAPRTQGELLILKNANFRLVHHAGYSRKEVFSHLVSLAFLKFCFCTWEFLGNRVRFLWETQALAYLESSPIDSFWSSSLRAQVVKKLPTDGRLLKSLNNFSTWLKFLHLLAVFNQSITVKSLMF